MRAVLAGLLSVALLLPGMAISRAAPGAGRADAVDDAIAAVAPYSSAWAKVPRSMNATNKFIDDLRRSGTKYSKWAQVLTREQKRLASRIGQLTTQVTQLQAAEQVLAAQFAEAVARQSVQERKVGAMARNLYQQPAPELTAVEQILEGENLRAFDRQDLITQVLMSDVADLDLIRAEVAGVEQQLAGTRQELQRTGDDLLAAQQRNQNVVAKAALARDALTAIAADRRKAWARVEEIRQRERAEMLAAAAAVQSAAAAAAAKKEAAAAGGPARPTGGGIAARDRRGLRLTLASSVPYRSAFITYGKRFRVEPSLLAGIALQESGFNPSAGCTGGGGGGKGIMQIEMQPQFCGPDAVPASIEKAARMLAYYYNRSGSWEAAVFAYNNGPGLMDEYVRYSGNKDKLLAVLTDFYDQQQYARSGTMEGYPSWGAWRARVAYSYAAPQPLPGFRSATQKWLIFRQG